MADELNRLLTALVEQGNRSAANELVARALSRAQEDGDDSGFDALLVTRDRLDKIRPHDRAVFVPLPHRDDVGAALCVRVDLAEGVEPVDCFSACTRAAVEHALDAAWAAVRGQGRREALGLRFPFGERVHSVEGRSLWLPVFLAAIVRWGDVQLSGSVMATGSFDDDLDLLDAKVELMSKVSAELGVSELVAATRRAPARTPRALRLVRTSEEAIEKVFPYRPWHVSAEVLGLHVHCGPNKSAPPLRFRQRSSSSSKLVHLPQHFSAGDLLAARRDVCEALDGAEACELSIAGPVGLASWLGCVLRNHPVVVRIVHQDRVWFDNRVRRRLAVPAGPQRALLIRCGDGDDVEDVEVAGQPGLMRWDVISAPNKILPSDLPSVVDAVAGFVERGSDPLLVATTGPMPLSFAVGALLQPLGDRAVFYQFSGGVYERWFSAEEARI